MKLSIFDKLPSKISKMLQFQRYEGMTKYRKHYCGQYSRKGWNIFGCQSGLKADPKCVFVKKRINASALAPFFTTYILEWIQMW